MPTWFQNLLVLLAVAACVVYLIRCARRTLNAKCGQSGSCCSTRKSKQPARPLAHERVAFLPVEMLSRKK